MKVAGPWIADADAQAVCAVLERAGYRALFVGGCVRNALLGAAVTDYDIATDAVPETVTNLAEKAGLKVVPTGIEHGTVTVISGGVPHEVTTFRRDVETDGRRAVVAFSTDVAEDAARRDFTMNALYAPASGELIDPLGGLPDLQARRVRFVGDAEQRIAEDYLRILRFFRFHAWYGDPAGGIDADGLAACAALSAGIETLSRERVGAEVKKLLSAPDPAPSVASMARAGVLAAVLAGAEDRALPVLVHLEGGRVPRWQARLGALGLVDWSEGLRLSRAEAREMAGLREAVAEGWSPAVCGWKLGAALGADAVLVRAALSEQALPVGWEAEVARGAATVFPVRAADLPDLSGAGLGAQLKALEKRWLAADLRASRDELLG